MIILNSGDILETIEMLTAENLDVRTVTMGISLLDCIDPDGKKACEKIYNKITRLAGNLVPVVNKISADYGIPIVNKRISVTPIAMLLGAAPDADPVWFAKTLDAAAKAVGVNFIGGYSALVQKGMTEADEKLIRYIPEAVVIADKELQVLECNRHFAELCGEDTLLAYASCGNLNGAYHSSMIDFTDLLESILANGGEIE